ncbi:MAG: GLUG motif-containing protein [bacterium]|nr:GLUG motif-containing protein [bacterium]
MRKTRKFFIHALALLIISSLIIMPAAEAATTVSQDTEAVELGADYYKDGIDYVATSIKDIETEEVYQPHIIKIGSYEELTERCQSSAVITNYSDMDFSEMFLLLVAWNEPQAVSTIAVSDVTNNDNTITVEMDYIEREGLYPDVITPFCAIIKMQREYIGENAEVKLMPRLSAPSPSAVPEIYWDGRVEIVPPLKTVYTEGEYIDLTGMEAYGLSGVRYSDGTEKITRREALSGVSVDLADRQLKTEDKVVTVSGCYSITGTSALSGTFDITVNPKSGEEPPINPVAPAPFAHNISYLTNPELNSSMKLCSYEEYEEFVNENGFKPEWYDEAYFENKMLSLLYITSDSSSSEFKVTSVDFNGQGIDFEVTQQTHGVTDDIVSWYLLFEGDISYADSELSVTLKEDLSRYAENVSYYWAGAGTSYNEAEIRKITSTDELGSWASEYDESFFESNFLLTVSWTEPVYTRLHEVSSIIMKNNSVVVELKEFEYGGIYPDALSGHTAVIELPKSLIDKEFSAAFNNAVGIYTAQGLVDFCNDVNSGNTYEGKTVYLGSNIDLSSVCGEDINGEKVSWTPIGANDNDAYASCGVGIKPNIFNGTFDGRNLTVSGLYINEDGEWNSQKRYWGLFGYAGEKAVIKNITVDGTISVNKSNTVKSKAVPPVYASNAYIGGIVGWSEGASIENCHNKAEISAGDDYIYAGGIAGVLNDGMIERCSNSGNVYLDAAWGYAGGICGSIEGGAAITNCSNTGGITSSDIASGISAMACGMENCFTVGTVADRNGGYETGIDAENKNCYRLDTANDGLYSDIEPKTAEQFASGEVAYLLGEAWGQKIGVDKYPVLGGDKVYCVNGVYTNDPNMEKSYPYEITDLRITDTNGTEISYPSADTSFIVEADVKKTAERSGKDYLFVAVYDTDGALLSLDYVKADFAAGYDYSFGFNIPAQGKEIGSVKAYVWNSFGSPEPLAEAKRILIVPIEF